MMISNGQAGCGQRGLVVEGNGQADSGQQNLVGIGYGQADTRPGFALTDNKSAELRSAGSKRQNAPYKCNLKALVLRL